MEQDHKDLLQDNHVKLTENVGDDDLHVLTLMLQDKIFSNIIGNRMIYVSVWRLEFFKEN